MRNVLKLLASSAVVLFLIATFARAQDIGTIEFVEVGIFTGRHQGKQPSPKTASGTINIVSDRRLVEATDRICARLGVFFGVTYIVKGSPNGANVVLDLVTRFPPAGMVNAKGKHFAQNELPSGATIGERTMRTFSFDEPWEMVPGTWTFEFHYKGHKIGETSFQVMTTCEVS
jgi:hypothetical protein